MYQFIKVAGRDFVLQTDEDGKETRIPVDPDNTEYKQVLAYIEAGGTVTGATGVSLAELKAAKLDDINNAASAAAARLTTGYPDFELQTWPDQQREAVAWVANNTSPTPVIDAMAGYRGIDRVLYLQKTAAKVDYFRKASSYLVGTRQKYADQVAAAKTPAAVAAISPAFTLPAP